jgi:hypothetical protein
VQVNVTLSIDETLLERARKKLHASGKTINQEIREHLQHIVGDDNVEREVEDYLRRAGQGNSGGWKLNRDEIYEERTKWPRT